MNQVLITSDSHGVTEELQIIRQRHQLNTNIHCGDSELFGDSPYLRGFLTVGGNCDRKGDFPYEKLIEIDGLRILIVHGHRHRVKSSLLNLSLAAKEAGVDIICFGHSHVPYADKIDNQIFINPGSIRLPKQYDQPSYVILQWTSLDNIEVLFYDLNGDKLNDLSNSFSL